MGRGTDYVVKDISLADWGRKEIAIAETEMPGLMATREEFGPSKPLKGARIAGSLHMTIQTAVLIETLVALGADVRWASCNIYSTQDHAAAAIAAAGVPVFAFKGETLKEYWDFTRRAMEWGDGGTANLILDDGGDATHARASGPARRAGRHGLPRQGRDRRRRRSSSPDQAHSRREARLVRRARQEHQGRVGGDDDGRQPPLSAAEAGQAAVPGDQRQRLASPSRSSTTSTAAARCLVDGIRRGTDVMMAGKVAMVAGFGDVGKGSAASLRNAGCRVMVSEIDPICALQASMEGYEVVTMEEAAPRADIFVTATGNKDVIRIEHMRAMKDRAIVANIGHFDNEIQVAGLKNLKWDNIKPQVDEIEFPDGKRIILLSEGRLVNLGNAMGHPSFVMSASFTNQTLAQIELWSQRRQVREAGLHVAQAPRREGRAPAPEEDRRAPDRAEPRAGGLHRRRAAGPLQGRPLPLLRRDLRSCRQHLRANSARRGVAQGPAPSGHAAASSA